MSVCEPCSCFSADRIAWNFEGYYHEWVEKLTTLVGSGKSSKIQYLPLTAENCYEVLSRSYVHYIKEISGFLFGENCLEDDCNCGFRLRLKDGCIELSMCRISDIKESESFGDWSHEEIRNLLTDKVEFELEVRLRFKVLFSKLMDRVYDRAQQCLTESR